MPIRPQLEVRGLKELGHRLREADRALPRQLTKVNKSVATKVADAARPLVPRLSGKAQASVKARATAQRSSVVGGGPTVPYYPWLEFGGAVGRNKSVRRERVKGGRYLFPTIVAHQNDVLDDYVEALNDVLRRNNLI